MPLAVPLRSGRALGVAPSRGGGRRGSADMMVALRSEPNKAVWKEKGRYHDSN